MLNNEQTILLLDLAIETLKNVLQLQDSIQ